MSWEVTAGEVGGVLTEVEQTLAQAIRWAEARLEGVNEDERASVEEEIEALAAEAHRLEGIGSYAGLILALKDEAEEKFAEMDAEECPECGERFAHASDERWEESEGRCTDCSEADHNDHEDYDAEAF